MSAGTSQQMQPCILWGILTIFQRLFTRLKYATNYKYYYKCHFVGHYEEIYEFKNHHLDLSVVSLQAVFGQTGLENETAPLPTSAPSTFGAMAGFLVPKLSAGLAGNLAHERSNSADQSKVSKRERHAVRPPVKHNWSLPGSSADMKPPQIFQHELLQNFSINMFCKVEMYFFLNY